MKGISWLSVMIGAWLIVAPWIMGYTAASAVAENAILGVAVVSVGFWSIGTAAAFTAPAWVNGMLGLWIMVAPWVIGYAHAASAATSNDVIVGIVIMIVAAIRIASGRPMVPVGPPTNPR